MTSMLDTIVPKSDQLNADDLIGGVAKVIKVTAVELDVKSDQPCTINYEGDGGKPFKPCLSMRRVLVNVWGKHAKMYEGRSMELFRDDGVTFGGFAVGGIRISRMSHMQRPVTMALTVSKSKRKPYTVQPLASEEKTADRKAPAPREIVDGLISRFHGTPDIDAHNELLADLIVTKQIAWLKEKQPALHDELDAAIRSSVMRNTSGDGEDAPDADGEVESV